MSISNLTADDTKIMIICDVSLLEDKQFLVKSRTRITSNKVVGEVTVSRKGPTLENAEGASLARATELNNRVSAVTSNSFTLNTMYANVILERGSKDPVSGVQRPDKIASQVTVDLVIRDGDEVIRQAVITRIENTLEEAEEKALDTVLALTGLEK